MIDPKLSQSYQQEQIETPVMDRVLLKRLLYYLKPYFLWVIVAILSLMTAKAIDAGVPLALGTIAQTVIEADEQNRNSLIPWLWQICLFLIAILSVSYLLECFTVFVKNWIGQNALVKLRNEVHEKINRLPISYFDRTAVGRLITRTIHDVDQINLMFTDSVIPIIGSLFLFLCITFAMLWMNWKVALGILGIIPFTYYLTRQFRIKQRRSYDKLRSILSALNVFVQENLMGINVIRNFGLQNSEKEKFDVINTDYWRANLQNIHNFAYFIAGIEFLQNITLAVVFTFLAYLALPQREFDAGTFFTFSLYSVMFFRPLGDLAERYNTLQSAMAAAERIFDILDKPIEPLDRSGIILEDVENIEFEDVWFAYENENWILRGLAFKISRNESLAIVGVTGAGKTTIINLLLRFYEHQKGSIKINGIDISNYDLNSLRNAFSVVLQDPVIFTGSIADNIRFFDESISKEEVLEAVKYVNLYPLLKKLPEGVDYHLSERGISLSSGEVQLISLARAAAHKREVLILDEATANIDTQSEKIIQKTLKKIIQNSTSIVIAHRLSTIKDVDKILVIYEGKLAEIGKHQELLEAEGIYEKLYRLQFKK